MDIENENGQLKDSEQSPAEATAEGARTKKLRKVFDIVIEVVLYLFLALCLFALIVSVISKKDADGAVNFFGYEMRIVASESMEKSEYGPDVSDYKIKDLKLRSMVFVKRVPDDEQKAYEWYSKLKVGDVLTFRYVIGSSQQTITHRITNITPTQTGFKIELQGDNRSEGADVSTQTIYTSSADYTTQNDHYNYVIGKVTGNSTVLGYIVYSIKQPVGTALIIIVPCSIIIIWQVIRLALVFGEDRKKKAAEALEVANKKAAEEAEERERQAKELEEVKRKLAMFESKQASSDGGDGDEK